MRIALRVLKWVGIVLGSLVGLLVVALVVIYFVVGARLNKTYDIQPQVVAVPADPVSIERGRHLAEAITACQDCHGKNLDGDILDDDPVFGRLVARNLTSG